MEMLGILLASLVSYILINNVILSQILGICSFVGISKKMENVFGMSAAVIIVMLLSTLITYPIYFYVLVPLKVEYLATIAFILVIASVVQLLELVLKKFFHSLYRGLGVFLPLITTNCAVLGVVIGATAGGVALNYLHALMITLGSAIGYSLILIAFSAIRIKLDAKDVPRAFKGLPIAFITAALMSLAFIGFSGLLSGLL